MADSGTAACACRLEETVGRHAACPEDACTFWGPGGAVLDGRCLLHDIDFSHEPGLAAWLIDVRDTIAQLAHR